MKQCKITKTNQMIMNNKIPISKAIIIILLLTILDTFTGVALLIGSYIYAKKVRKGLAMALCAVNFVIPDILPLVDEIFQLVVVAVPVYKQLKADKN